MLPTESTNSMTAGSSSETTKFKGVGASSKCGNTCSPAQNATPERTTLRNRGVRTVLGKAHAPRLIGTKGETQIYSYGYRCCQSSLNNC